MPHLRTQYLLRLLVHFLLQLLLTPRTTRTYCSNNNWYHMEIETGHKQRQGPHDPASSWKVETCVFDWISTSKSEIGTFLETVNSRLAGPGIKKNKASQANGQMCVKANIDAPVSAWHMSASSCRLEKGCDTIRLPPITDSRQIIW